MIMLIAILIKKKNNTPRRAKNLQFFKNLFANKQMELKWSKGKARYIDLQPVATVTPIGSLDNGVMCIMGPGGSGVTSADWHK